MTMNFPTPYNPSTFQGRAMSKPDQDLIERLLKEDEEYKKLHEAHLAFEERIEALQKRPPSTEIHFEIESLKKQKLQGKDKMERILTRHR